jgi:hypothetical protein
MAWNAEEGANAYPASAGSMPGAAIAAAENALLPLLKMKAAFFTVSQ